MLALDALHEQRNTSTKLFGAVIPNQKEKTILDNVEVLLPLTVTELKGPVEQYIKHIRNEFASKYLMQIGLSPNPLNIASVLKRFPLHKCKIDQVLKTGPGGDKYFISIKPQARERAKQLELTQKRQTFTADDYKTPFALFQILAFEKARRGEPIPEDLRELIEEPQKQKATAASSKRRVSISGDESSPGGSNNATIRTNVIPSFEEYTHRFVYPYNVTKGPTDYEGVKEMSLYQLAHRKITEDEDDILHHPELKDGISSVESEAIEKINENMEEFPFQLRSRMKRRSSTIFHGRMVRSASVMSTATALSSSQSKPQKKVSISVPAMAKERSSVLPKTAPQITIKDSFPLHDVNILKERFPDIFSGKNLDDETISQQALNMLFDKELARPPYLTVVEVVPIQKKFTNSFPFHLWKEKVTPKELVMIKKTLTAFTTAQFIKDLAEFSYWSFLAEYAESGTQYEREDKFIEIYEEILDLLGEHKTKKVHQVVHLPIMILCVRVVCECIYSMCYPQWWASRFGEIMASKINNLISFLFDPSGLLSHLPPVESNVKERKLISKARKIKQKLQFDIDQQNKANMVSPVVRFFLQNAQSTGAKKLVSKDKESLDHLLEHKYRDLMELFSPNVRQRLLSVIMKKKCHMFTKQAT